MLPCCASTDSRASSSGQQLTWLLRLRTLVTPKPVFPQHPRSVLPLSAQRTFSRLLRYHVLTAAGSCTNVATSLPAYIRLRLLLSPADQRAFRHRRRRYLARDLPEIAVTVCCWGPGPGSSHRTLAVAVAAVSYERFRKLPTAGAANVDACSPVRVAAVLGLMTILDALAASLRSLAASVIPGPRLLFCYHAAIR